MFSKKNVLCAVEDIIELDTQVLFVFFECPKACTEIDQMVVFYGVAQFGWIVSVDDKGREWVVTDVVEVTQKLTSFFFAGISSPQKSTDEACFVHFGDTHEFVSGVAHVFECSAVEGEGRRGTVCKR